MMQDNWLKKWKMEQTILIKEIKMEQKYTLVLQRIQEFEGVTKPNSSKHAEGSTIGKLILYQGCTCNPDNALYECYCVENAGPSTDTPRQDKRIFPRAYKLYSTPTSVTLPQKYKGTAISLYTDELPQFKDRRIHIHIGNYPQDTAGCILPCRVWTGKGYASQSTQATQELYDKLYEVGLENVTMVVREIVDMSKLA